MKHMKEKTMVFQMRLQLCDYVCNMEKGHETCNYRSIPIEMKDTKIYCCELINFILFGFSSTAFHLLRTSLKKKKTKKKKNPKKQNVSLKIFANAGRQTGRLGKSSQLIYKCPVRTDNYNKIKKQKIEEKKTAVRQSVIH